MYTPALVYGDASRHVAICEVVGASHASNPRPVAGGWGAALMTGAETANGSEIIGTPLIPLHPGQDPSFRWPHSW